MIKQIQNQRGSTIIELIMVIVLFVILIPSSLGIYLSARKITGQSYIQHQAAVTLGETADILSFIRNQGYDLLTDGTFYLIRNPGTGSWLTKSDLPNMDTYERSITISDAIRHQITNNLYLDGDTGDSYVDSDTKKIIIKVLWSPDYLPLDLTTHTIYMTNWHKIISYYPE